MKLNKWFIQFKAWLHQITENDLILTVMVVILIWILIATLKAIQ